MEINRTGPRNPHPEDSTKVSEQNGANFKHQSIGGSEPVSPGANTADVPAGITRADLNDEKKTDEILKQYFSGAVDQSSRDLGVTLSAAQKQKVVEFMAADPVMRGKVASYLRQVAS
jgi:hypothetical protein